MDFKKLLAVITAFMLCNIFTATHAQVPGTPPPLPQTRSAPQQSTVTERLNDHAFVQSALQSLATQVELSKIADRNARDEKVREYAGWILKDYEAAAAQLRQLANNAQIDAPAALDAEHTKIVAAINRQPDADFDAHYIELIKTEHDNLLALLDRAHGESTLAVELREYSDKLLPTLKQYQKRAETLKKSLSEQLTLKGGASPRARSTNCCRDRLNI